MTTPLGMGVHTVFALGLAIAMAVICCGGFALAVTGRRDFNELERRNLNKVAVMSAVGVVLAFAVIVWQLV